MWFISVSLLRYVLLLFQLSPIPLLTHPDFRLPPLLSHPPPRLASHPFRLLEGFKLLPGIKEARGKRKNKEEGEKEREEEEGKEEESNDDVFFFFFFRMCGLILWSGMVDEVR